VIGSDEWFVDVRFMTSCGAVRYRVVRDLLSLIQIQHERPLEAATLLTSIKVRMIDA